MSTSIESPLIGSGSPEEVIIRVNALIDMGKSQKDSPTGDHAPCSFSASAMPMLSGTPPLLLAGAILYIFDQAHQPDLPFPAAAPDRLRPPLRGPPSA